MEPQVISGRFSPQNHASRKPANVSAQQRLTATARSGSEGGARSSCRAALALGLMWQLVADISFADLNIFSLFEFLDESQ